MRLILLRRWPFLAFAPPCPSWIHIHLALAFLGIGLQVEADVANLFECPHGIVDGGLGKCRICTGPKETKKPDARRAREALLQAVRDGLMPKGYSESDILALGDDEATALAELWTDFEAEGGAKAQRGDLGRRIAELAKGMLGRSDYEGTIPANSDKPYRCNWFVFDVLMAAGLTPPLRDRWGGLLESKYQPLAEDYANPQYKIPGLPVAQGMPQLGDIVAIPEDSGNATGHVGIVVAYDPASGKGRTVSLNSVRPYRVVENDFGFRHGAKKPVFRRPQFN